MGATTKQFRKRNAIYECLRGTTMHPSAEMLHEMARDEARHGKALKGLLERYFE